ncbi:MAG: radical SAM protein [Candidatus Omnitrophota bacterium]
MKTTASEGLFFQWHITDACNFRCRHCYQHRFTRDSELALPELIKVYENIAPYSKGRKINLNITGGEPFLRKDLFDLLRFLDGQKETGELAVITNASLIDEKALEALNGIKKLKAVKVSLDGATEKTNDAIRKPGAFRAALEKINLIQERTRLDVIIMLTLMRSNSYELPALFQLCRELRVNGLMLERFIPLGQSGELKAEVMKKEDWKKAVKEICEYMEVDLAESEVLPCKAFWVKFEGSGANLLTAECNLGEDAFAIMPNGDLLPCRRFDLVLGNLLRRDLSYIVKDNAVLRDISDKSKLKGKCRNCQIERCRGCRALAYAIEKDYLAEDHLCWL